ncbi:MAG: sensor histidine kinase [Candidatus Sericytochromatia bacterium]
MGEMLDNSRSLASGQAPVNETANPDWLASYESQEVDGRHGHIGMTLLQPGIICFELRGTLDLVLAKAYSQLLETLYEYLSQHHQRIFMVINAIGLERLSLQAQHYLLAYGRRDLPGVEGIHCAVANPLYRALLRLFEKVNPIGSKLIRVHQTYPAACEAACDHLRHRLEPLDLGPELTTEDFEAEHLSIRYHQPAPHLLLCSITGVLNAAGARHLMEVNLRLLTDMKKRHGRTILIVDSCEQRHTTIEAYKVLLNLLDQGPGQIEDLLITISRFWPRAVQNVTQRLMRNQDYRQRTVTSLEEALAVAEAPPSAEVRQSKPEPRMTLLSMRRKLREQAAEIASLRQERESFLNDAGKLMADILLHKEDGELAQLSNQAGPYQELFENLFLIQREYREYLNTLQQEIDVRIAAELQAAELSQIKSRFLANVSHELRTPLNAIIGFTNLVLKGKGGPLAPQQRLYIERVHDNSMHLLALINDVLDISKIETGSLRLRREPVSISDLLGRVLEPLFGTAGRKGLELSHEIDADTPDLIDTDPDRLRQILTNLVNNAIKFTASGGISVRFRRWQDPPFGLALEVEDTGIGIPSADQKKIFEAFTQLHQSEYAGSGLGLSICHSLAHELGYRLELESKPGQGSTFRLLIPAKKV